MRNNVEDFNEMVGMLAGFIYQFKTDYEVIKLMSDNKSIQELCDQRIAKCDSMVADLKNLAAVKKKSFMN